MICECGKKLHSETLLTKLGNVIDYQECEDCGVIGTDI